MKAEATGVVSTATAVRHNSMIYNQIAAIAHAKGYIVESNRSKTQGELTKRVSKYYASRPDLLIYHPADLRAAVIAPDPAQSGYEEADQGDADKDEVTLRGGSEGQLLGGMEKVAGEVALGYLIQGHEKLFNKLVVYGLILNFQDSVCTAHKLTMDFDTYNSVFETGNEQLEIVDGLNRLLRAMKILT